MTLLKIAHIGHPVLRQRAREVEPSEIATASVQTLIDDMIETMRDANGAGLAANQVHVPLRICVIEVKDNPRYPYKPNIPLTVLINPVLAPLSDETFEQYEGCLSVPDMRGQVRRHAEIRVTALDREGRAIDRVVRGISAGTYQHECDHLDGTIFVDRVTDPTTLCTWKEFAARREAPFREHVQRIVARYGS